MCFRKHRSTSNLDAWLKNDKFGIEEPSSWHKKNAKNYQRLTLNQVYEINLIE